VRGRAARAPRPHHRRRADGRRLPLPLGRSRPRPRPASRRDARRRRTSSAPGRRAGRDQGRPARRRAPHDLRLADPGGLPPPLRGDRGREARGQGRDRRRQDEHGRVRDGLVHREQRLQADPQPVGPGARPGRVLGGLGRRGGVAHGAPRPRQRHRRLDPPAGRVLRPHRSEAHLGPRQPLRPRGLRLVPRPGRPSRPHRRGRGPRLVRPLRAGPARRHERRGAAPRLRPRTRGPRGRPPCGRALGLPGRGRGRADAGTLPGVPRRPRVCGRLGERSGPPPSAPRDRHVLPRGHRRGLQQPRPLRRRALRPPRPRHPRPRRSLR